MGLDSGAASPSGGSAGSRAPAAPAGAATGCAPGTRAPAACAPAARAAGAAGGAGTPGGSGVSGAPGAAGSSGAAAPDALRIPARLACLDLVAEFVLGLGARAALPESALYRLRLAADELATNIVMHGYRGTAGEISVDGGIDPDQVWVRFEDDAPAFDPRQGMRAPALDVPLAERQIGGLGVFLAFTAVDSFEYELVAGRNVSTLVMRRSATAAGPGTG
ncbi:ATP-binding protein [Streptomyces sp. CA-252508]|uniref:ATP-binding protein n=1 Tax=Streptomyces sp. CA-252508 TaxID=3418946 RepID=UPI003D924AAE